MEQQRPISAHERNCLIVFAVATVIQTGHMVEHTAQLIQWLQHLRLAQGIIGEFDLEPVHFVYNGALLVVLSALGSFYGDVLRARGKGIYAFFMVAWVVQTYHMVEHVVKIAQYAETGIQGTPGILGRYFAGVPLHFVINLAVTVPMAATFFLLGMHKPILRLVLPKRFRPA